MPNIKSGWKHMRTSETARQRNVAVKTALKHVRRKVLALTEGSVQEGADAEYRAYCSALDKAVKAGTLKKNTAIRRKARAAERLRKTSATPAPASETPAAS
ncbi:MAG: 30S ribosomal protein S20 [Kiritimatiellia bacterium]|nr:30S ribosomal protein S20 [Kiritimatiellia bacterium]